MAGGDAFRLRIIEQYFGAEGWGHNTYQSLIWQTLVFHPAEIVRAVLANSVFYPAYLRWELSPASDPRAMFLLYKYAFLPGEVIVKLVVLIVLPLGLSFGVSFFENKLRSNEKIE